MVRHAGGFVERTAKKNKEDEEKFKAAHSIGEGFCIQLRKYFRQYQGDDMPFVAIPNFIKEINADPESARTLAGSLHPLTQSGFEQLCAGKLPPTEEFLQQSGRIFIRNGLSRNAVDDYITAGQLVIAEELKKQQSIKDTYNTLRIATNPGGDASKPSFIEMLEESHRLGENFKTFLFERVLPTWELSSHEKFCRHVATLTGNDTITSKTLDNWENSVFRPNGESVDILCRAFHIERKEGAPLSVHEKNLRQAIDGHRFSCDKKGSVTLYGKEAIDEAIAQAKEAKAHGPLLTALCNASGIPWPLLEKKVPTRQLYEWCNNTPIASLNDASSLLELLSAVFEGAPEEIAKQQTTILSLITGREFNLEKVLKNIKAEALRKTDEKAEVTAKDTLAPPPTTEEKAEPWPWIREGYNPGGDLFGRLTGRKGMVPMGAEEMVKELAKEGQIVNTRKIEEMRNRKRLTGGGRITEPLAEAIMAVAERHLAELAKKGIAEGIPKELHSECVDILTNCPHPKIMLAMCRRKQDGMTVGKLIENTIERRGMKQETGDDSFAKQVGITHVGDIIHGTANMDHDTSAKLAKWYGDKQNYAFSDREQRLLMAMAQGVDVSKTPKQIVNEVCAGTMQRQDGLRLLYDQTGLTRAELADKAGVPHHVITRSMETQYAGMLPEQHAAAICHEVGVSGSYRQKFLTAFCGKSVRKTEAPKPEATPAPAPAISADKTPAAKVGSDPTAILDQVVAGTCTRPKGLRLILEASGKQRHVLANVSGVRTQVLDYAVKESGGSDGKINAPEVCVENLAGLCGMNGTDVETFKRVFCGNWISRSGLPGSGGGAGQRPGKR